LAAAAPAVALVAQVLPEAQVQVVVVLAQLPVPTRRPAALLVAVLQALPATTWLPRVPLLAALLVVVALLAVRALLAAEVAPVVAQLLLLSRHSFSAAMARSTP
jgi:hypothetical protein